MSLRAIALKGLVRALASTWTFHVTGTQNLAQLRSVKQPFIYALWHAQILPLIWYHRHTHAALVVSSHRDGALLAEAAETWGFKLIRGSSTRGGLGALRGVMRSLETGEDVAMTPDGPRGPARAVKRGIVLAAQKSGVPILPVRAMVDRSWKLQTWDRFEIPRPFAKIGIWYGPTLDARVTPDVELMVAELEGALNHHQGAGC